LDKIVEVLQPLTPISLEDLRNKSMAPNTWQIEIPNLDVPVSVAPATENGADTEVLGGSLQSLIQSIFANENLVTILFLNSALWIVVVLMLREYYYRLKAQKHAFEISVQAEKNTNFAILGELATSIAHEINQPLAVMQMRTSMMLDEDRRRPLRGDLDENLQVIKDQVHRCSEIVKSVQSLNSKTKQGAEKIKLDDFFRDIRAILDLQTEKYNGKLDLSCPNNLYVEFNKTALEQIALNLSRNGFEAMSHLPKTKRVLTINAKSSDHSHKSPTVIEFIDRGRGLNKAKQEKVFEAFYSTKSTGTGLGLALSKTLAEQNNANISVESTEGIGSCFKVKIGAGYTTTNGNLTKYGSRA
ncbi:MAG: HAMP domain-containing sensor histidine kinase, partial [Verrucomicrobiota bacterium]|nr:HAMP domain-containing sensor histidine kinase [Verrucomicrobiota bacterium]